MHKRFLRIIALLLALCLFGVQPAFASDGISTWGSYFIQSYCPSLEQITDTAFRVWFEVSAVGGYALEIGASEIQVQRSADGTTWTTMNTYTPQMAPRMLDYNTGMHAAYIVYPGTSGYYYRARVVFYVKNDRGIGEIIDYTEVLHLLPLSN